MKKIIPCVFITLALMLAGSFLPVIGFIGLVLCPLPLAVLGCLEGQRSMSVAELMVEATLFLAVSPSLAVYCLIGCAPVSAVIFMLSRKDVREVKKFTGGESLLICTGTSIAFKVILLAAFWFFTGRNILFPSASQMNIIMSQLYGDQPELMAALSQVLAIFPHLLPSMLVIYAGVEAYLNYSMCYSLTRKILPGTKNFPPELPAFTMWRFPVSLLMASVAGLVFRWLIDLDEWFTGAMFVINLQIIVNIIMFIQGLSLAFWIMEGFRLRKGTKIGICILLSIPFFWAWLIVMGMSDMALNLRERVKFSSKN